MGTPLHNRTKCRVTALYHGHKSRSSPVASEAQYTFMTNLNELVILQQSDFGLEAIKAYNKVYS